MSLAGVRRVWEDLSPRKGIVKKQKGENMGTISGANESVTFKRPARGRYG